MNREEETPYVLFADECNAYLPDVSRMLDQLLKFGLSMVLSHHRPSQFEDDNLRDAIEQQCKLKFIFGGMPLRDCYDMAQILFPNELNELWVKAQKEKIIREYELEETESTTTVGERESTTKGTRYAPRDRSTTDDLYHTRDDKIHFYVAAMRELPPRHCLVQYEGGETIEIETPFVEPVEVSTDELKDFIISCTQGSESELQSLPESSLKKNEPDDDSPNFSSPK